MIFGKYVNKYYIKHLPILLLGILALLLVDVFQLKIPELYRMIINGLDSGVVEIDGVNRAFDMQFVLDEICLPMLVIIFALAAGRFLWRVAFFGTAIRVETDLRSVMFDHSKNLSQEFYQRNKVGNMMSLYTNDLETINECFGDGVLMLFDALLLGTLAIIKMWRMSYVLTLLSLIPMVFVSKIYRVWSWVRRLPSMWLEL